MFDKRSEVFRPRYLIKMFVLAGIMTVSMVADIIFTNMWVILIVFIAGLLAGIYLIGMGFRMLKCAIKCAQED